MVAWIFLLLVGMNMIINGEPQLYTCPNENGLFYTTNPECLMYYRCEDRMLKYGVCFPWHRFDIHTLTCKQLSEVDCNPKYAGIWRPVYVTKPQDNEGSGGALIEEDVAEDATNATEKANEEAQAVDTVEQEEEMSDEKAASDKEETAVKVTKEEKECLNKAETVLKTINSNEQLNTNYENGGGKPATDVEEENTGAIIEVHEKRRTARQIVNINSIDVSDERKRVISEKGIWKMSKSELPFTNSDRTEISGMIGDGSFKNSNAEKTNCLQENCAVQITKQRQDTTASEETKQEVSPGGSLYWCGSGRYVTVQSNEDANTICLQLQDPEYIFQESGSQEAGDMAGHTYLGADTTNLS